MQSKECRSKKADRMQRGQQVEKTVGEKGAAQMSNPGDEVIRQRMKVEKPMLNSEQKLGHRSEETTRPSMEPYRAGSQASAGDQREIIFDKERYPGGDVRKYTERCQPSQPAKFYP